MHYFLKAVINAPYRTTHGGCSAQTLWLVSHQSRPLLLLTPFPVVILLDELEKAHKVCCSIRMIMEHLDYS